MKIIKTRLFTLLVGILLTIGTVMAAGPLSNVISQNLSNKDMDILIKTVVGESRGENMKGMQAVAEVILNRVRDDRFPSTVSEVCLQPKQFSCWNKRDHNRSKINGLSSQSRFYRMAKLAVNKALYERRVLPENVTHFHTRAVSPGWAQGKKPVARIKQHVFYSA